MQYKSFMEALKGKQKKLDKNHNGELDAQDFKILRKEENELDEALDPSEIASNPRMYSADSAKKAYYHKNASAADKESLAKHLDRHHGNKEWRKPVKEEQEINESTAELDKHISDLSKRINTEHGANHSTYGSGHSTYKNGGGKIHNMKHVSTDASHEAIFKHLQKMGYKKTSGYDPNPHKFDVHHNHDSMTSKTDPVHHPSGISAHVETEHGSRPKVHFTHRGMKEEVEQIDEISQKLAGDYYGAATKKHVEKVGVKPNMYDRIEKDMGKQRKAGVDRALDRVTGARKTNEEFEVLDESEYLQKTLDAYNKDKPHYAQAKIDTRTSAERRAETDKKLAAQKKPVVQPAQPVKSKPVTTDDIHKQIAKSYANHRPGQYVGDSYELNGEVMSEESLDEKLNPSMGAGEYIKDFQKSDAPQFAGKSKEKRRVMGIAAYLSAKRKMKEEVELDESYAKVETKKYSWGTMKTAHHGASFSVPMHPENHKAVHALKDNQEHKFKDETGRHWTAKRMGDDVHLHSANDGPKTKIKHSDLAESHAPVAPVPARKYIKGTPEHKAAKEASKPRTGHPTNVKEEAEQIEERNKQNALMRKTMDASRGARFKAQGNYVPDPEPQHKTAQAHNKAIGRAIRKMSNEAVSPITLKVNHALEAPHEETWEDTGICPEHNKKDCHECGKAAMKEDTGQKSYKEFMMMLEYESDKSGSYKHTGTYGSEYAKKEREKDEKGFDSENEPAKRGPKMGSKRGPKANLGSSKLHTK